MSNVLPVMKGKLPLHFGTRVDETKFLSPTRNIPAPLGAKHHYLFFSGTDNTSIPDQLDPYNTSRNLTVPGGVTAPTIDATDDHMTTSNTQHLCGYQSPFTKGTTGAMSCVIRFPDVDGAGATGRLLTASATVINNGSGGDHLYVSNGNDNFKFRAAGANSTDFNNESLADFGADNILDDHTSTWIFVLINYNSTGIHFYARGGALKLLKELHGTLSLDPSCTYWSVANTVYPNSNFDKTLDWAEVAFYDTDFSEHDYEGMAEAAADRMSLLSGISMSLT